MEGIAVMALFLIGLLIKSNGDADRAVPGRTVEEAASQKESEEKKG